jgi:hypothetical protein
MIMQAPVPTPSQLLSLIPQRPPMRFVDVITEVDDEHILGQYTWTPDDCQGYMPNRLVVPPFKLMEMAAQIGNVAWCLYHMRASCAADVGARVGVMTEIQDATCAPRLVKAGETVSCVGHFGEDGFFRSPKLLSAVELRLAGGPDDGLEVFSGMISGLWIPKGGLS